MLHTKRTVFVPCINGCPGAAEKHYLGEPGCEYTPAGYEYRLPEATFSIGAPCCGIDVFYVELPTHDGWWYQGELEWFFMRLGEFMRGEQVAPPEDRCGGLPCVNMHCRIVKEEHSPHGDTRCSDHK